MTCYHPRSVYKSLWKKPNGKHSITFNTPPGAPPVGQPGGSEVIQIPCGQCIGCRLERSRQWAIRCSHEASLYDNNSFITLTYDDAHLPPSGSLDLSHFQKFMKRLRKSYKGQQAVITDDGETIYPIRFFHCGEYGELKRRPHYHACLFNFDFPDKKLYKIDNEQPLYNSKILDDLWGMGHAVIGNVTFQSAAYVARYITKKITGEAAEAHYTNEHGEILKPEYTTMSRRPGIAADWFKKFGPDVFPGDFVVMNNRKMRPPKFYDRQYELTNPEEFERIKEKRIEDAKKHEEDQTYDRLKTREFIQEKRFEKLHRKYEKANQ